MPANTLAAATSASQQTAQQLVISDETGLIQFYEGCRLDSYSKDLYVTLDADISLSGEFTPIPVFGGTFYGAVNGSSYVGGIAGINEQSGLISGCIS